MIRVAVTGAAKALTLSLTVYTPSSVGQVSTFFGSYVTCDPPTLVCLIITLLASYSSSVRVLNRLFAVATLITGVSSTGFPAATFIVSVASWPFNVTIGAAFVVVMSKV